MDFKDLLLMADKNSKLAAKQSQQVKRINTNFTTPAKIKDDKASHHKSEVVQKLLEEKEREKREKQQREERKRKKEAAAKAQEQEAQSKNAFRIPKKPINEGLGSDADSFSSISSDDEAAGDPEALARFKDELNKRKDKPHESHSSKGPSSEKHSSSDKPSTKQSSEKSSSKHSSSTPSSKHKQDHSSSKSNHQHSSKNGDSHSKSNRKESSSERPKSSNDHSHSNDKEKHLSCKDKHSDKPKHSEEDIDPTVRVKRSSHGHKSETKRSSSSQGADKNYHKTSLHSSSKLDIPSDLLDTLLKPDNDSSGYITSPDISSDEEESEKKKSNKSIPQRRNSQRDNDLTGEAPIELTRHHLKPTVDRQGCTLDERNRVLAKLQAIRDRMNAKEDGEYSRKRAARGDVKKRRAKREKLDGDFSGPCRDKIDYDEEDKPSLKRPEPKPEEPKVKKEKVRKVRTEKKERIRPEKPQREKSEKHRHSDGGHRSGKSHSHVHKSSDKDRNLFDAMRDKPPKVKPRRAPMPPPLKFEDLLKMAEQKQSQPPTLVEPKAKKEERRPMTQDEIDRKQSREEWIKTKDYKDWYQFGEKGAKSQQASASSGFAKDVSSSGGFLRKDYNVVPPGAGPSKPGSGQTQNNGASKTDRAGPSSSFNSRPSSSSGRPSSSETSAYPPPKGYKPQQNPARPVTIANNPQAMAQNMKNVHRESGPTQRSRSPEEPAQRRPVQIKTAGGNAWDNLLSRPEYKKLKEPPAKKGRMVIDSEEEEEYDEEMDDFIDDEGDDDMENVSGAIRDMFGYDRRRYQDDDEDDRNMEVGFTEVMKEEARSARLGRKEDLEDIRREEEEKKRKKMMQKQRR